MFEITNTTAVVNVTFVTGRGWKKKKSKIRNAVQKGSGKSDETEECNT
jgi:hypothetical protein